MLRTLAFAGAIVASTLLLGQTSDANAQTGGGYYAATFSAPPAEAKAIARGLVWTCNGETCTAPKSNSRPAIVCAAVAREIGSLQAFRAAGEPFDAEALAKCNERAG